MYVFDGDKLLWLSEVWNDPPGNVPLSPRHPHLLIDPWLDGKHGAAKPNFLRVLRAKLPNQSAICNSLWDLLFPKNIALSDFRQGKCNQKIGFREEMILLMKGRCGDQIQCVKSAGEIFLDAECGVGDVSGCTWWLFLTSLHDQAGVECGHWVPLLWVIASVAPRLRPLCDADHWLHNNVILITPLWSPPVPDPSPHFLHYCQNWLQPPPCVIMRWTLTQIQLSVFGDRMVILSRAERG